MRTLSERGNRFCEIPAETDGKNVLGVLCGEEHVRRSKGTRAKAELTGKSAAFPERFGGSIQSYNCRTEEKPKLEIAGTGHRFFNDAPEKLKERVKEILAEYGKTNRVTVRTCFAYGADQLIAECALELGCTLKSCLPMPIEKYIETVRQDVLAYGRTFSEEDERKMRRLLAQTAACRVVEDPQFTYAEASRYIVNKCDKLIAVWDGKEIPLEDRDGRPINRGGTYDCIKMAEALKKEVIVVGCCR